MRERDRVQKKQCPQCGWDAEGVLVEKEQPRPDDVPRTRYDPQPKRAYDCGNCGYQWVQ